MVLFFVALNVSLFIINESNILTEQDSDVYQPYSSPQSLTDTLIRIDLSAGTLALGTITMVVSGVIGWLTERIWLGGTLGIILFALDLLFPLVRWIFVGFPLFLSQMGVPSYLVVAVGAMMAVPWFWFILGFIGQRTLEK